MADQSFDVRAFLARVESANVEELTDILVSPSKDEEKALRLYLGDQRYHRMHDMAVMRRIKSRSPSGPSKRKGNVVVIHGIMGGELSVINPKSAADLLWVSYWRLLVQGWIDRLWLDKGGRTGNYDVRATGIMKKYYGELVLTLNERWTARAFWYDWRKDLKVAADDLNVAISNWFGDNTPVHIVAHSMGGLVARTFIERHPERWESMWEKGAGGRLVMLGTPNHGSFTVPQIITGLEPTVKKLAKYDLRRGMAEVLRVVNSFVGTYQMLPSPFFDKSFERLYKSTTYGDLKIPQELLDDARSHHELLKDVVDPKRMIYIAGDNQLTFSGIKGGKPLDAFDSYDVTRKGDGRVTHEMGLLKSAKGEPVKTYYVEESHGELPRNPTVLSVIEELLETGSTVNKMMKLKSVATDGTRAAGANKEAMRRELITILNAEEERFDEIASRARAISESQLLRPEVNHALVSRGGSLASANNLSAEEIEAEESIIRGFIASYPEQRHQDGDSREADDDLVEIGIGLVLGDIGGVQDTAKAKGGGPRIDAIAAGHYLGVRPQDAELALDQAISLGLPGKVGASGEQVAEADLLLTQYTERGIIRGELGQPFFLADPRKGANGRSVNRTIAVAGMGVPGRFGMPELTVTVRELCWSLGRLGKKHLATVLIGAGNGNLSIPESISGWMRGIRQAISGSPHDEGRRLMRITFVERDYGRIRAIESAIVAERDLPENSGLKIKYTEYTKEELKQLRREISGASRSQSRKRSRKGKALRAPVPSRVSVQFNEGAYRFGAITESASIPERDIPLDEGLVRQANKELAAGARPGEQLERGRFLEGLIVPEELRPAMSSHAPLVMMLDARTARIHWEAMAQPDPRPVQGGSGKVDYKDSFLGTSRGFTRQLRTTFAPPPEPPPPPRRVLRVLVVADPAANAPLAGAEEEGLEVAKLFESFNEVWNLKDNRVEVVLMSGPGRATRTNVLRELMLRTYDVLHYAGHCEYKENNPAETGWLFGEKEYLTANELNRIDRVPKFVFSNACESGVTPERAEDRSVELAPSFAEAFFKRGVSNFVCTAWPVDDVAARQFAITLYSNLLGLAESKDQPNLYKLASTAPNYMPDYMYEAMRKARIAIANTRNGVQTWGAYQHYGNPYLRFFDWESLRNRKSASSAVNSGKVR